MTEKKLTLAEKRAKKEAMKGYNKHFDMTDGKFRGHITSAFRELFRNTRKKQFVKSVRFPTAGDYRNSVSCVFCARVMGTTEKFRPIITGNKIANRERLRYDVDHQEGITPLKTIDDIQSFFNDLMFGSLQILCYECHKEKTADIRKAKR